MRFKTTIYLRVQNGLHFGGFDLSVLRVLHYLRVVTRVDNHSDHPLRVLQSRTSQDKLVVVQGDEFFV